MHYRIDVIVKKEEKTSDKLNKQEQTWSCLPLRDILDQFHRYWQIPTNQKLCSQLSRFSKCNYTEEMAEYDGGLTTKQTFTPC